MRNSSKLSWLWRTAVATVAAGLVAQAPTARADTITPFLIAGGGAGVWTYGADHTSGELHPGDGFTIYDFGGYVGGSAFTTSPVWAVVAPTLVGSGFIAPPTAPPPPTTIDLPGEFNLHFVYTGPTIETIVGLVPFGLFGATTTYVSITVDDWRSADHTLGVAGVVGDGVPIGASGTIVVPAPLAIPDGGLTVGLLGLALVGLEGLRRKLRFTR